MCACERERESCVCMCVCVCVCVCVGGLEQGKGVTTEKQVVVP